MDGNVKFVLAMIAYVLKGGTAPKQPNDLDWEKVYHISVSQAVVSIVAYGVVINEYHIQDKIRNLFVQQMYAAIAIDQKQRHNCEEIFSAFEENKLDYLPLKGAVLKEVYPEPEMRSMSDVDILIRKKQFRRYKKILLDLGYRFAYQSDHEYVFQKNQNINVELHKCLIPSYNDDMYAYYQSGWNIARKKQNQARWNFTEEDFFVYLVVHFAKHYRDAGVGIKYVIDIWLWKTQHDMDASYINTQLQKMGLLQFFDNLDELIQSWFDGKEISTCSEKMLDFMINSGQYGNLENADKSKILRMSQKTPQEHIGKVKYWQFIFPDIKTMSVGYPMIKRVPFLLPFFWIYRIAKWGLFQRDKLDVNKKVLGGISPETVKAYLAHMESVGLDIYNGRKHINENTGNRS